MNFYLKKDYVTAFCLFVFIYFSKELQIMFLDWQKLSFPITPLGTFVKEKKDKVLSLSLTINLKLQIADAYKISLTYLVLIFKNFNLFAHI